jgi:hypothetical protein
LRFFLFLRQQCCLFAFFICFLFPAHAIPLKLSGELVPQ